MKRALVVVFFALVGCGPRVGDFCDSQSMCHDRIEFGYCSKAGVCTRPCGPQTPSKPLGGSEAIEQAKCPSGSECVTRGSRMICLAKCSATSQCAKGLECVEGICELVQPFTPLR